MKEAFSWSSLPGSLMKRWPKAEDGSPVQPKYLTHCGSTDLADVILENMLEAYEIPVLILHPGDGDFGKVVLGLSGTGSSIYVPETMYEHAKELMEAKPDDELQS